MPIMKMADGTYKATYGGQSRIFKTLNQAKKWASKFTGNRKKTSRKMSY